MGLGGTAPFSATDGTACFLYRFDLPVICDPQFADTLWGDKGGGRSFLQISKESAGHRPKKKTSDGNLSPESEPVLNWPDSAGSVFTNGEEPWTKNAIWDPVIGKFLKS